MGLNQKRCHQNKLMAAFEYVQRWLLQETVRFCSFISFFYSKLIDVSDSSSRNFDRDVSIFRWQIEFLLKKVRRKSSLSLYVRVRNVISNNHSLTCNLTNLRHSFLFFRSKFRAANVRIIFSNNSNYLRWIYSAIECE